MYDDDGQGGRLEGGKGVINTFPRRFSQGYSHGDITMARVFVEFAPGELELLGGDYGAIYLQGLQKASRDAIDAVVTSARLSGRQPRIGLSCEYDDASQVVVENWHAGREGTPEAGVGGADAAQPEPAGAEGVASEAAEGGQTEGRP